MALPQSSETFFDEDDLPPENNDSPINFELPDEDEDDD